MKKIKNADKRILVTATELTLKQDKLQNLIAKLDNEHIVDLLSLQELVRFAEKFDFSEETVLPYLKERFSNFDLSNYGTVVLGCTHFTFFKDMIKKLLPEDVDIIDGNMGTVNNLRRILEEMNLLDGGNGNIDFYNSGVRVEEQEKLRQYKDLLKQLD